MRDSIVHNDSPVKAALIRQEQKRRKDILEYCEIFRERSGQNGYTKVDRYGLNGGPGKVIGGINKS